METKTADTKPLNSNGASLAGASLGMKAATGALGLAALLNADTSYGQGTFDYIGGPDRIYVVDQPIRDAAGIACIFNGYALQPGVESVRIVSFSASVGGRGPIDGAPDFSLLTPTIHVWAGRPYTEGSTQLYSHSYGVGGYASLLTTDLTDLRAVPIYEMVLDTSSFPTFQVNNQLLWIGINFDGNLARDGTGGVSRSTLPGLPSIRTIGNTAPTDSASSAAFNVTIANAAPEPTTAALTLLGLGMLGVWARRK